MDIQIKHSLTRDEAKSRIMGLIGELRTEYGGQIQDLKEEWVGHTDRIEGSAKGFSVSGTIDVKDAVVNIALKIPFMLRVFGARIRSAIEERVKKELVQDK